MQAVKTQKKDSNTRNHGARDNSDTTGKPYRMAWAGLEGNRGGSLIAALFRTANERGQHLGEMAHELGVTYGYINQLRTGMRKVEVISASFTQSVARYLRIPPVLVMLMVGRIRIEDFLMPSMPRAARLKEGLHKVEADPMLGCVMPQSIWTASADLQEFVLALYQDASQSELFPQRGLPMMLQDLQRAALAFEDDKTRLAESLPAK